MRALTLGLIIFIAASGQQSKAPLTFGVADIQAAKPGETNVTISLKPGGRVDVRNASMQLLVAAAYGVDDSFVSGPASIQTDRFNIVAKASPSATEEELIQMLRALLAERFKLAVHMEKRVVPVYALVVGKKCQKMQPAAAGEKPGCPRVEGDPGQNQRGCKAFTMEDLADLLPNIAKAYVTLPVVDMTELKGAYNFQLDWMGKGPYNAAMANSATSANPLAVSIFDAVEKLGLKLEERKHSMDTVVVDHVERIPTEN
jgi:uncharacterized protein (TIGR03435 family)